MKTFSQLEFRVVASTLEVLSVLRIVERTQYSVLTKVHVFANVKYFVGSRHLKSHCIIGKQNS